MTEHLSVTTEDHVTVLTFDRPPANFVTPPLLEGIVDAAYAAAEAGARAIVITGGGKHFCAGVDFNSGGLGEDKASGARVLYAHAERLFSVPIPIVAAVNGSAVGAGLGLACAADFRVASPTSRLLANFSTLGFHQGFALSVTLPHIVGEQRAAELLYLGRPVRGEEALRLGLVDRLVEEGEELAGAMALANELAGQAPLAVRSIRQTLRKGLVDRIPDALAREVSEQAWLWQTEDAAIGLAAVTARETPVFVGR